MESTQVRNRVIGCAGVLALGAVVACIALVSMMRSSTNPIESIMTRLMLALNTQQISQRMGNDPTVVCFTVNPGENAGSVASRLAEQGFTISPDLFRAYMRYFDIDSALQAGTFSLTRTMTMPQLAQKLTKTGGDTILFRVLEGWRIEEIAQVIDSAGRLPYRGADFLSLVGTGAGSVPGTMGEFAARAGIPAGRSLEGFLFPDTYTIPACGTVQDLVARMLANFDARVTAQMRSDTRNTGLTLYQAVTLASIVQREALFDDERPMIAGVYLNRYNNSLSNPPNPNIPRTLDADPTIQYALGNTRNPSTWWPQITGADYRSVIHPYNTYINVGLPPGPISNPGLASIQAAIYPQASNFIYFRACPDSGGRHRFSITFAEHQAACG